jgi:hypothetical protein
MISTGQVIGSATASHLVQVPAGPCEVVISNGGTGIAYIGAVGTGTVTTATGIPVPSGATFSFNGYQGSPGATLEVIVPAGTSTLGFLVSTSWGLPQPGTQ